MQYKIFRTERRVEFRDTDAAGIMHFSTFFTYMEEVEHEFLRSLGRSVMPAHGTTHRGAHDVSWPRVAARSEYRAPLRFEQTFEVQLAIERMGGKSVTYGFEFLRGDNIHAVGTITAVCCRIEPGQAPHAIKIPDDFRELLQPYVMS